MQGRQWCRLSATSLSSQIIRTVLCEASIVESCEGFEKLRISTTRQLCVNEIRRLPRQRLQILLARAGIKNRCQGNDAYLPYLLRVKHLCLWTSVQITG